MFTKKPEPEKPQIGKSLPTVLPLRSSTGGAGTNSFIGPDLVIVGNLTGLSIIQIEGRVDGDVHAKSILIGPKAKVVGNVVGDDVTVSGEVDGTVRGLKVTLNSGSRVVGEMHHKSLSIEHGAHFEGQSKRPDNAAELAPKLDGGVRR